MASWHHRPKVSGAGCRIEKHPRYGAMRPTQFLASTWAAYGVDGDSGGVRYVYKPADAVAGTANYLWRQRGRGAGAACGAVWDYNTPAGWTPCWCWHCATDPPAGPRPNLGLSLAPARSRAMVSAMIGSYRNLAPPP